MTLEAQIQQVIQRLANIEHTLEQIHAKVSQPLMPVSSALYGTPLQLATASVLAPNTIVAESVGVSSDSKAATGWAGLLRNANTTETKNYVISTDENGNVVQYETKA